MLTNGLGDHLDMSDQINNSLCLSATPLPICPKALLTGLTWLPLVMSLMASICAVLFHTGCFGWDLGLN